jgi:hypothetical protein
MRDSDVESRIQWLLDEQWITGEEADVMQIYFRTKTIKKAAEIINMKLESFHKILAILVRKKVLIREKRGQYSLSTELPKHLVMQQPVLPDAMKQPLVITPDERKWMRQNYHKYSRSEVAKILGRSKFDVNRMAMSLKIDSGKKHL